MGRCFCGRIPSRITWSFQTYGQDIYLPPETTYYYSVPRWAHRQCYARPVKYAPHPDIRPLKPKSAVKSHETVDTKKTASVDDLPPTSSSCMNLGNSVTTMFIPKVRRRLQSVLCSTDLDDHAEYLGNAAFRLQAEGAPEVTALERSQVQSTPRILYPTLLAIRNLSKKTLVQMLNEASDLSNNFRY